MRVSFNGKMIKDRDSKVTSLKLFFSLSDYIIIYPNNKQPCAKKFPFNRSKIGFVIISSFYLIINMSLIIVDRLHSGHTCQSTFNIYFNFFAKGETHLHFSFNTN